MAETIVTQDDYIRGALLYQVEQAQAQLESETEQPYIGMARRGLNAYTKALHHYLSGVQAQPARRGYWTVPSATVSGQVYMASGDSCTCPAGANGGAFCWHQALVIGLEIAEEAMASEV